MPKITIIEGQKPILPPKKKVAAYARVSKDTEQLMHSLSTQVSYYSDLIQRTPGWEYAGVYVDNERTVTGKLLQELIDQNARVAQDQTDYQQRSDEMFARYEAAEKALAEAQESLRQKEKHNEQIEDFISEIEAMPDSITDFRTDYWGHLVEKVTVHRKGKLVFTFSCGVEIEV